MAPPLYEALVERDRTNALLGWVSAGATAAAFLASLWTGDPLWAGFALVAVGLAVLPAVATRDWQAMVPWPALALTAAAALVRSLGYVPEIAGYVAVAGLSLVAVAALEAFTPVAFTRRFAVAFAAMTTLALSAVWIVVQYYADVLLATGFLGSQTELQRDIVAVTGVGAVVGVAFHWLFEGRETDGDDAADRPADDRSATVDSDPPADADDSADVDRQREGPRGNDRDRSTEGGDRRPEAP